MDQAKIFFFFLMLIGFSGLLSAQKNTEKDIWSGAYLVNVIDKGISRTVDTLVISRIENADPKKIPAKEESDLIRWAMASKRDGGKNKSTVKRFLFDIENDYNGYEEFGWTNLHKEGKMDCIDGGHFFICRTQPDTTVTLGKDETYFTQTGVFGIWLHYGVVEIKKE